jgi:hypothetical protein
MGGTEEQHSCHGRERRALRTGINRAQADKRSRRPLGDVDERRAAAWSLRRRMPGMWRWREERFSLPGDAWWAAFGPGGEAVAIAQVTIDRELAVLRSFVSTHRASRYLLHTELVDRLARADVRYLATDGPMAPMLEPALQYWQQLLGYRIFNLDLYPAPLAVQDRQLAGEAGAEEALSVLAQAG